MATAATLAPDVAPGIHVDWSLYGGVEKLHAKESTGSQWMPAVSTHAPDTNDFLWTLNEEPHRTRRMAILKAHPEVRKLMGREPITKYVALGVVTLQISVSVLLTHLGWHPLSWRFMLMAYVLGGVCNQNLFLAIHEITHNLAFKSIAANKLLAIIVNFPTAIPFAMTFKLFFYAIRPGMIRAQQLNRWHFFNIAAQLTFDVLICYLCGSLVPLYYFLMSSFCAGSLHPVAGHFIAEHYVFSGIEQETWSYYGILNWLTYNVGYHNEHHDFPSVPWTRLPELRKLAPEFYDVLPYHTSWTMVIINFIFSHHSGLHGRVKRAPKFKKLERDPGLEDKPNNTGWEVSDAVRS